MEQIRNAPYTMYAKTLTLVVMNMRYEKIAFQPRLHKHPYLFMLEVILDPRCQFAGLIDAAFIEFSKKAYEGTDSLAKEENRQELFNEVWNRCGKKEYGEYIQVNACNGHENKAQGV